MDEIVIKKWCDIHAAEDDSRVEAVDTFTVYITEGRRQGQSRLVVTCPEHSVQVRSWMSLIRETGQRIAEEKIAPAEGQQRTCPACGGVMHRQSIIAHLVDQHGAKRIKQPVKCPDCGDRHEGQTSMVAHRRRHGYDYMTDVVATIPGQVRGGRKK